MNDLTATALHSMIHKQFELWNEQGDIVEKIRSGLLEGCTKEDSAEEVYARMIFNAMEIAAGISAKVILEMLLTSGVIEPSDEEQIRKSVLSVVK